MRFLYGVLIFLCFSCPALAAEKTNNTACYPAQRMTNALVQAHYVPVATMESAHFPAIFYVNLETDDYMVFVLMEDMLCLIGEGRGFTMVAWRTL